jgi:uncharacterized protein (TIGR02594 family)
MARKISLNEKWKAIQEEMIRRGFDLPVWGADGDPGDETADGLIALLDIKLPDWVPEPAWVTVGRQLIGLSEIRGPKHNRWIVDMWQRLGYGIFKTDEVPWCGGFIAHCIDAAGYPIPRTFPRAKDWGKWGVECEPQVGAIGTMSRSGGGHVIELVGITADRIYYKGLGGNQNDQVNISDFHVDRIDHLRLPEGYNMPAIPLPIMPRGTISRKES